MKNRETKILRYTYWAFYFLFIPIILLLAPSNALIWQSSKLFLVVIGYLIITYTLSLRFNFVTYIIHRNWLKSALSILCFTVITFIAITIKIDDIEDLTTLQMLRIQNGVIFMSGFIVISFTVAFGFLAELIRRNKEHQELLAEKNRAELAMYKSQINPHFMFNTLNTIYSLNFAGSENTGEVIMKFSDIVRYMYQNSDKERVLVIDEVVYLREFIEIHSMRLSKTTKVDFHYEIDDESALIPSMIFITFIENAFKYGVSSSYSSTISVSLTLKEGVLLFTTRNTIFQRNSTSSGIGIKNCEKRLSLLYPSRYSLKCTEIENNIYKTELKIKL
ncbi:MAG: histidine kinase [Rikenellaceae bacterium]